PAAPAAPAAAVPPPPPPPPAKPLDLQARLKSLLLRVKSVNATAPALKGKLEPLFQAAAGLVQKGSADAPAALDKVEAALKAVRPDGTWPGQGAEAVDQARVKAMTEDLKKAITSGTEAGKEARLRFSESQLFSRKQDFAQAMALLDVVEGQIKQALAGA